MLDAKRLLLAMSDFCTHAPFSAADFATAFPGPFRSHSECSVRLQVFEIEMTMINRDE